MQKINEIQKVFSGEKFSCIYSCSVFNENGCKFLSVSSNDGEIIFFENSGEVIFNGKPYLALNAAELTASDISAFIRVTLKSKDSILC